MREIFLNSFGTNSLSRIPKSSVSTTQLFSRFIRSCFEIIFSANLHSDRTSSLTLAALVIRPVCSWTRVFKFFYKDSKETSDASEKPVQLTRQLRLLLVFIAEELARSLNDRGDFATTRRGQEQRTLAGRGSRLRLQPHLVLCRTVDSPNGKLSVVARHSHFSATFGQTVEQR